jgi:hypothetical protein
MKCCERKILLRMKKEAEQAGFKDTRTGHRICGALGSSAVLLVEPANVILST